MFTACKGMIIYIIIIISLTQFLILWETTPLKTVSFWIEVEIVEPPEKLQKKIVGN